MRPSFQMQYPVDKEVEEVFGESVVVCGSFFLCYLRTDNDLAALLPDRIREHVWGVGFAAKL